MTTAQTASAEPPKPPAIVGLAMDDPIRELGDRIAALSPIKAVALRDYLIAHGVNLR